MKKILTGKKLVAVLGLILSLVFVVLGAQTKVPNTYISYYGSNKMEKYVGGDAYNYIIESSLRGGQIAGAQTQRAAYFMTASILGLISLFGLVSKEEPNKAALEKVEQNTKCVERQLQEVAELLQKQEEREAKALTEKEEEKAAEDPARAQPQVENKD